MMFGNMQGPLGSSMSLGGPLSTTMKRLFGSLPHATANSAAVTSAKV
jgi:hypothetical protein